MDLLDNKSLAKFAGIVAASLLTGAICYEKFIKKSRTKWVMVGTVDKLYVHPLKGGKAKEVYSADFGWLGLKTGYFVDRSFMLINMRYIYPLVLILFISYAIALEGSVFAVPIFFVIGVNEPF